MIGDVIKYKGYVGVFEFDEKTSLFLGKVSNVHHLVTFQGKSVESAQKAFHDAVNEYIYWCEKHGKIPERLFTAE
jgi:predicted HicB family RNase H-like nuclease